MVPLFAGMVVLVAVMMIARWFATVPPGRVLQTAKWTGVTLVLGSGVLLLAMGRLAWVLAAFAGLIPWALRLLQLHHFTRTLRATFGRRTGGKAASGRVSTVETRFLRMRLDLDNGTLTGEVVDGPHRGRALSQLSFDQAMELRRHCAADPQSVQILEAWLDRTWQDWRARRGPDAPPAATGNAMSVQEAYDVLGLAAGADRDQIKAAHRRLMSALHPDHGGSNYLAAKINQAKELLLGE